MDLNATRHVVSVVQAGSLSAAATRSESRFNTEPRIQELERQPRVQLLERSARGTEIDRCGARLYGARPAWDRTLLEAEQAVVSDLGAP